MVSRPSMVSVVILVLLAASCLVQQGAGSEDERAIYVATHEVINIVDKMFVSSTLDFELLQTLPHWRTLNLTSARVRTLLGGLSPGLIRLGGSGADHTIFTETSAEFLNTLKPTPPIITITKKDIRLLVDATKAAGLRLLLDQNLQLRYGDQWDPTNVISLLDFLQAEGYGDNIDFEMGNEPNAYGPGSVTYSGQRIGQDFVMLRDVIYRYPLLAGSHLVGPDTVSATTEALDIFSQFVNTTDKIITAATFHHYYFHGTDAKVADYINPALFSDLANVTKAYRLSIAKTVRPDVPLWLGETADAWGGGTQNVSDRFVSGFLWMDKLGYGAQLSLGLIMRQTFYGGNYALIDNASNPNPDYWLSYVHKQLVGQRVLQVYNLPQTLRWRPQAADSDTDYIRVYAHCTKPSAKYKAGAVTLFGLNMYNSTSAKLGLLDPLSNKLLDAYLMTPDGSDGIVSKYVALNGKRLSLVSDTELPQLVPDQVKQATTITLPPFSYGFFVFPDADVAVCN